MKHDFLKRLIDHHDISDFFEEVSGIQDHLANGKDEMADGFIQKLNLNPKQLLWIGDTLHDYEIAERLGIESILVSNGHQSADRLKEATENVFANLWEVAETVLKTELKNENS